MLSDLLHDPFAMAVRKILMRLRGVAEYRGMDR
jgi:hypothetical protein